MKEFLTYGFHPEYESRKDRLKLIHHSRKAVRVWNESVGVKVFKYKSETPDVVISEMTRKRIFETVSDSMPDVINDIDSPELDIATDPFMYKLVEFVFRRLLLYGKFAIRGVCLEGANNSKNLLINSIYSTTHELGHTLGLIHSGYDDSVMRFAGDVQNPSIEDVKAVKMLIEKEILGGPHSQNSEVLSWYEAGEVL